MEVGAARCDGDLGGELVEDRDDLTAAEGCLDKQAHGVVRVGFAPEDLAQGVEGFEGALFADEPGSAGQVGLVGAQGCRLGGAAG